MKSNFSKDEPSACVSRRIDAFGAPDSAGACVVGAAGVGSAPRSGAQLHSSGPMQTYLWMRTRKVCHDAELEASMHFAASSTKRGSTLSTAPAGMCGGEP